VPGKRKEVRKIKKAAMWMKVNHLPISNGKGTLFFSSALRERGKPTMGGEGFHLGNCAGLDNMSLGYAICHMCAGNRGRMSSCCIH